MNQRNSPGTSARATSTTPLADPESTATVASQQVSWWSVHQLLASVLNQVNGWPLLGTPAWCSLANDDPRKWAAVLDGGQHHALRMELNQEARAEASRAISGAANWAQVGRDIQQRRTLYAARPWLKRSS